MLLLGDCLDVLPHWPDCTFHLVCTDPPYGLDFMGKHWDHGVPGTEYWRQVLRVAKPGAYLTAFGGTRTFHRLVCAIEDAGWEVRDCFMYLFGTGFPKSHNVEKALRKANNEPLADCYVGYGTSAKPAYEPIVVARKPLVGTVAQNVQQYGTGGLNIEATRIATIENLGGGAYSEGGRTQLPGDERDAVAAGMFAEGGGRLPGQYKQPTGRWPPNVLLGHAADCTVEACAEECLCRQLDEQAPKTGQQARVTGKERPRENRIYGADHAERKPAPVRDSLAGASRFFPRFRYTSKTSRKERAGSSHPTIKPLAVVEWLLKLTAPPGKPMVLDPFVGSGTTLIAAERLGIRSVGIEKEAEYVEQAYRRFVVSV